MIFSLYTCFDLKVTVKIRVSFSNLCDVIFFNASSAFPILFGHSSHRNPLRITIPSTSKVAVSSVWLLVIQPTDNNSNMKQKRFISQSPIPHLQSHIPLFYLRQLFHGYIQIRHHWGLYKYLMQQSINHQT